jgi:hypothetical protein
MVVATSAPTRLLEAESAGKEEFFAMLEGVECGDDVQCGKPGAEILLKAARFSACLLASGAHNTQGQNLNKKLSEGRGLYRATRG